MAETPRLELYAEMIRAIPANDLFVLHELPTGEVVAMAQLPPTTDAVTLLRHQLSYAHAATKFVTRTIPGLAVRSLIRQLAISAEVPGAEKLKTF